MSKNKVVMNAQTAAELGFKNGINEPNRPILRESHKNPIDVEIDDSVSGIRVKTEPHSFEGDFDETETPTNQQHSASERSCDRIYIQKTELKKADAFRINSAEDIPENLRDAITIDKNEKGKDVIKLECREGAQEVPLGRVVRFEKTDPDGNCPHGINAWAISPEGEKERFVEKDGVFYQKPTPTEALPIGDGVPEFLDKAEISKDKDGTYNIKTDWGVSSGKEGEAYWVKYGDKVNPETGEKVPDANILTKTEKSFDAYSLCTANGENICKLKEYDKIYTAMQKEDPSIAPADIAGALYRQKYTFECENNGRIPDEDIAKARGSRVDQLVEKVQKEIYGKDIEDVKTELYGDAIEQKNNQNTTKAPRGFDEFDFLDESSESKSNSIELS